MSDAPRMLVLLPNWLGDVAMATPALRALHHGHPDTRLSVAGRAAGCALLAGLPYLAQRLPIDHRPGWRGLRAAARELAPHARGGAVVLSHSFRTALLARWTGAPRRVGLAANGRGLLLTDAVPRHRENGRRQPRYTALEFLRVAEAAGGQPDDAGLALAVEEEAVARVQAALDGAGPLVGLVPGAAFGPSKQWPPERFAAVADALVAEYGARVLLLHGPDEAAVADAVAAHARTPLLRLPGPPSVAQLKAAVSLLDLMVSNDTGPRHLAVAFGVPVVCVMGPTSPRYTASPWERGEVVRIEVDCGPCQRPYCATDHRCMTGIAPARVVRAAAAWLPARV